mgnify:CR=1 FL=1
MCIRHALANDRDAKGLHRCFMVRAGILSMLSHGPDYTPLLAAITTFPSSAILSARLSLRETRKVRRYAIFNELFMTRRSTDNVTRNDLMLCLSQTRRM